MPVLNSKPLLEGRANGPLLKLSADISFWGGVDPQTGKIIDSRHPEHGRTICGKILAMDRSIGSSSGSSILLELLQNDRGPLGIILLQPDFIITLGAVVAREMGFAAIPVVQVDREAFAALADGVTLQLDGEVIQVG
ncbi:MAG: DUF126 domain-containing protein [Xanthomonadales bacterium]|nr:DUF126 domain-containing protein [Gammaproteobacteria bacterium]NND56961.1 DUF126 domain-containing protein [Xanthomonadales bacterium]NNK51919.1 DUF126 domain-containing protein [Xanthomonadales bacterium]